MKNLFLKFIFSVIVCACITNIYADDNMQTADLIIRSCKVEKYNNAAKIYWEFAINDDSIYALQQLDALYNQHSSRFAKLPNEWNLARRLESTLKKYKNNCDLSLPKRYLQDLADKYYPLADAKYQNVDFIVIASENRIIEEAIYNLRNDINVRAKGLRGNEDSIFSGKNCGYVGNAVDTLKKDILIDGKKGQFLTRSRRFKDIGIVALVSKEIAISQFDFPDYYPIPEYAVYVRSQTDPNVLIPFGDYHRYTYEKKMKAFLDICGKLGAKWVKVYREEVDKSGTKTQIAVSGGVKTYGTARSDTIVLTHKEIEEEKHIMRKYEKPILLVRKEFQDPWLDREPDWMSLYKARFTGKTDPGIKYQKMDFYYTVSRNVDIKTSATFKGVGWDVAFAGSHARDSFKSIHWIFEIEFYPWDITNPFSK